MTEQIWTDEKVAEWIAQGGRVETSKESAKWDDFYQEYDYLVNEGWNY